jgi:pimeloyl-ACP methyl ester carboxylesterase
MTSPTKPNPILFIHGLWIHSDAWRPWIDLFESLGYQASAPGWPGDGHTVAATRNNPDALNDMGITMSGSLARRSPNPSPWGTHSAV